MLSSPTFRTLSFFLLYFVSGSGDGTLSVFNVRRQKIEERSDNMESELLSLAIVKVKYAWELIKIIFYSQARSSASPRFYSPFKPQYQHMNSPNWALYISLKNVLREFDKRSRHFLLGDQFINSHNLISWQSLDMVRRKLMLVTIGT